MRRVRGRKIRKREEHDRGELGNDGRVLKHCDGVHANARAGSQQRYNLRVLNR